MYRTHGTVDFWQRN